MPDTLLSYLSRPRWSAAAICLLAFIAMPQAHADYVRIEVGSSAQGVRIPQTFPALMERFTTAGYAPMWPDGPYHDAMATSYGPGEYGSFTIMTNQEEIYVSWLRADALQAAEQTEADTRSYLYPGAGIGVIRDGHVVVTLTSYMGNDVLIQQLLDAMRSR